MLALNRTLGAKTHKLGDGSKIAAGEHVNALDPFSQLGSSINVC